MSKWGEGKKVLSFRIPIALSQELDKAALEGGYTSTSILMSEILTSMSKDPGTYTPIAPGAKSIVKAARVAPAVKALIIQMRTREINNSASVWCWLALHSWISNKTRLQINA